jgi:hypothetical protein
MGSLIDGTPVVSKQVCEIGRSARFTTAFDCWSIDIFHFPAHNFLMLYCPSAQITGVSFSLYSSEEIRKLSVKRITNPLQFDSLNHPTIGGLYDPALGPQKAGEVYVLTRSLLFKMARIALPSSFRPYYPFP